MQKRIYNPQCSLTVCDFKLVVHTKGASSKTTWEPIRSEALLASDAYQERRASWPALRLRSTLSIVTKYIERRIKNDENQWCVQVDDNYYEDVLPKRYHTFCDSIQFVRPLGGQRVMLDCFS